MFGFKKSKPNITVNRTNPTTVRIKVDMGKETYGTSFTITELFPEVSTSYLRMKSQLETKQPPTVDIWHILGCLPTKDPKVVQAAFRKMSLVYHPDQGGNTQIFGMLVEARDLALAQCK